MSSRKTLLLSAITTALLASAGAQAAALPTAIGAGEGQLDIVAWPGYIENGSSDKAYDWVSGLNRTPAARSTSRLPPPRMRWSA